MTLSKTHLELMVLIIDACSSRGAFKGEELRSVGELREVLLANIKILETEETKQD
jgi:hypothetical protein